MDFVSHGLWGGAAVGRKNLKLFLYAVLFSVLPDIAGEGIMFALVFLGADNMPSLSAGHPNITEFPAYAQNFYNATHSLLLFAAVFVIVWLLRKQIFWPLAAWGIHILIDIPTHSLRLFPTPFLWPISDFRVNGQSWDSPYILIPNYALLIIVYAWWYYRKRAKRKLG